MSIDGDRDGTTPQVRITVCPGGPLLVRGPVDIVDENGEPVGRQRTTVALCRCGASSIKPFCDGTHKRTSFGRNKM